MSTESSFRSHRKHKLKAEINVVPFIDVMLVLLIIFMITVPVIHTSVQVNLPENIEDADKGKAKQPKKPLDASKSIVVQVLSKAEAAQQNGNLFAVKKGQTDSQYFLNDEAGVQALINQIELLRANKTGEDVPVVVFGDTEAEYGDVLKLFLQLKKAGLESTKLATQPAKAAAQGK
ncbi:MAG: biopolymer transporter ExbD [Proteobacteria bacterium]|jgi:biopolymer transport protein TolR|nr:biopolymer transporter ExbD [Pseudomonadota bacterium]